MKQARLSFGGKRKEKRGSVIESGDVIFIGDSPEPPTKKLCLEDTGGSMSIPPKNIEEERRVERNATEPLPDEESGAIEESEFKIEHSDMGVEMGDCEPAEKSIISTAESSILDESIAESTADDENHEENTSDNRTTVKRKGASRTEAAFKRLKRQKEKEQKMKEREEREKMKNEEKQKRDEEKQRREQEKKDAKERKERERLEKEKKREEERSLKEKERMEKEKRKEEEKLLRETEKLLKEAERTEKEKEREKEKKKREEERQREIEEEMAKKEKAKKSFMSFFVKKNAKCQDDDPVEKSEPVDLPECTAIKFKPFALKKDMKLAQLVCETAKSRFDSSVLDHFILSGEKILPVAQLYLSLLKNHCHKPLKRSKTQRDIEDVVVVEDPSGTTGGRMKAKFLQFVENYRPAYFGTWRKSCSSVGGRRPFGKFPDFDYSVDSDDEWEEGEGESLEGTDDEKEKEEHEEDYEEDDFLVPHGYLSESEEEEDGDDQPMDPAALKARIAARQEEFKADRKVGIQKKKIVSVCAIGENGQNLEEEFKVLKQFQAVLLKAAEGRPLLPSWEREPEVLLNHRTSEPMVLIEEALKVFCECAHGFEGGVRQLYEAFYQKWKTVSDQRIHVKSLKLTLTATCRKSKALSCLVVNNDLVQKFSLKTLSEPEQDENTPTVSSKFLPDDVIPELIKATHGNSNLSQIVNDFMERESRFVKAQIKRTLRQIATFDHPLSCWLVKAELLSNHNLEDLDTKLKQQEESKNARREKNKKEDPRISSTFGTPESTSLKRKKGASSLSREESPSVDTEGGKENKDGMESCKGMSIKNFFSPHPRAASTPETPKSEGRTKKRIQLTTLSRTPTLKQDSRKTQSVLEEEELILIDDESSDKVND